VLDLKAPHGTDWRSLRPLVPALLVYVLSFVFLGIYWNNHHHLLHACEAVTGGMLWANLHLLFWLSLVPFATAWMADNHFAPVTVASYGSVLLLAAMAYFVLVRLALRAQGRDSMLARAIGRDVKGVVSPAIYVLAIALSFALRWVSLALYVLVALIWLVPDRRIESRLSA
jgi:uncharacterized membrane protein